MGDTDEYRPRNHPYAMFGAIYDRMHPEGWHWADLTNQERADFIGSVEPILNALGIRPSSVRRDKRQARFVYTVKGEWVKADG